MDNPGSTEGTNDTLTDSDGDAFDLGSLRLRITRQACDKILSQGTLLQVAAQVSVYYTAVSIDRSHAPSSLPRNLMLETAVLAARLSWISGFRLYSAIFAAGALGCMGWLYLPSGLQMPESWWVISLVGVLAVVESLVDKVPGPDSVWDGIQTFIRVPAGVIPAAAAFGQLDLQWMVAAGLIGGTLAGTVHAIKAGTYALINMSPEPPSNWVASFSEDVTVSGGLSMVSFPPIAFLVVLALSLLVSAWLLPKLWRGMRQLRDALRGRSPGPQSPGTMRLPH